MRPSFCPMEVGWNVTRILRLSPGGTLTGPALMISNCDALFDTMLAIDRATKPGFRTSTLSSCDRASDTAPNDRPEGEIAMDGTTPMPST